MADTVDDRARDIARIAEQNDAFRCKRPGGGQGEWVYTQAVHAEGQGFVLACVAAVAAYDDFNEDIDPYGTHEMGTMEVMGKKVWWKIDLYDCAYEGGSPNPTSLAETRRVLTILFPSDY